MDLAFETNQSFSLAFNVTQWKPVYPLTVCTFHMQVRTTPGGVPILYSWSSDPGDLWGNGVITYTDSTGILLISAPYSDMVKLVPGEYSWDLVLIYGTFIKVLTGGAFVIRSGVTIQ